MTTSNAVVILSVGSCIGIPLNKLDFRASEFCTHFYAFPPEHLVFSIS